MKITSRFDGVIKKLHYEAEDVAQVGKPLCDIDVQSDISSEDEAVLAPAAEQAGEPASPQQPQKAAEHHAEQASPEAPSHDTESTISSRKHSGLATPAVRGLLKELGISISEVPGTGKDGRVLKEDVHRYATNRDAESSKSSRGAAVRPSSNVDETQVEKIITLNPIQSQMFKTMTRSLTIPHFLYADEIDVTAISTLRQRLNVQDNEHKLSFLHFIIKAVSLALEDFPLMNARVEAGSNGDPTKLIMREKHNIGIAMDTPQGLLVPNIKNVSSKSILDIASECSRLQALAKDGKLSMTDLTGGTITISNIGSIGGTYVAPVIVQSEVAILGVGKARTVPAFGDEGQVIRKDIMNFSWSADHRVIDGATMARMAERVRSFVEEPSLMMARLR
ncbi:hypothetical protein ACLMJK_004020 [Lecanora helva]